MSTAAIRVDALGKRYTLGATSEYYSTLRDQIRRWATPWTMLHRNRSRPAHPPFWALRDVSFEVEPGEVVGIIGRNGSGKSTLLKILSRITEPTEGAADIRGRVGSLLEVGTGFHPELTGRENIYLNGAILGMKRAEIARKFDEIIDFAEVTQFVDTPVKHYSSGMYTRLAFAVAAHLEPEILIVDEVLAVGDAQFQRKCLGRIGEVARGGRTVLFVSHNMGAIQSLCRTVVRLAGGRAVGWGPAAEQVAAYLEGSDERALGGALDRPLGPELRLRAMRCTPGALVAGASCRLTVTVAAQVDVLVEHLCGLVYSALEVRVAIIDLRSEGGAYRLKAGQELTVEVDVRRINLVPGTYRLGLFVGAGATMIDVLDLTTFDIVLPERVSSLSPYAESSRGLVELDCSAPVARFIS